MDQTIVKNWGQESFGFVKSSRCLFSELLEYFDTKLVAAVCYFVHWFVSVFIVAVKSVTNP
jgi:hypothetical protein